MFQGMARLGSGVMLARQLEPCCCALSGVPGFDNPACQRPKSLPLPVFFWLEREDRDPGDFGTLGIFRFDSSAVLESLFAGVGHKRCTLSSLGMLPHESANTFCRGKWAGRAFVHVDLGTTVFKGEIRCDTGRGIQFFYQAKAR